MASPVIQSIPASQIVSWNPSVIGPGGAGFQLNGLFLTTSTRLPIGSVQSFPTAASVAAMFGSSSVEAAMANVYFLGPNNSTIKPGALLMAQYPWAAPVAAYLQSGSLAGLTLAQLQALSGTIIVTIDGTQFTSGTINLGAATSFSNAAGIIQTGLAADEASVTGAIAAATAATTTSTIAGTTFTIGALTSGVIIPGSVLSGTGVATGTTVVKQLTGTAGGAAGATFQVNIAQTTASASIAATSPQGILTVSAVGSGTLAVGQNLSGTNVVAGTYITGLLTGTGSTGTYIVNQTQTVASTTIAAGSAAVTYDSQSGSFFITGGTQGVAGTIGYATGTLATPLNLTQATGAVLSQGAAIATPAAFMNGIVAQTQNWFTLVTLFDPLTADKVAFANWINGQDISYLYVESTHDAAALVVPDTTTAFAEIQALNYNGTIGVYDPNMAASGPLVSAFISSWAASLNFNAANGRSTLAFRSQAGIPAGVNNGSAAANLAENGYNYYGVFGAAGANFTFAYDGDISGEYAFADSYANAAYIKNALQAANIQLLTNVGVIPYTAAGDGMISESCAGPIAQFGKYGGFAAGVELSQGQIAEVNALVGFDVATTLQATGWYLFSNAATTPATTRATRGSPTIIFLYTDGQSIQKINGSSVAVL